MHASFRLFILVVVFMAAMTAGPSFGRQSVVEDEFSDPANVSQRGLRSSGGIGAFSPPAPGFSRNGGVAAASLKASVALCVTFLLL